MSKELDMKKNIVNYYKILGVEQNATQDEIKKAYKYLVLTKHPDVNKTENASVEFMAIIKAYNLLKNETKRADYDKELVEQTTFFTKINFKYVCDKVISKSDNALKKLSKVIKNIAPTISKYDEQQYKTDVVIPPEVVAMSHMPTSELEMRLQVSDNMYVRAYSAFALGVKCDKSAISCLEKALNDREIVVREKAVWAIGKLKMRKTLPTLQAMFYNSGSIMKKCIIDAVYEITGGRGRLLKELINVVNNLNKVNLYGSSIKLEKISAENKVINV